jgi:pimeloyl-ACP methyl ester carboxylesterase
MRIKVNGVELCVETFGNPADPPVLLAGVTMLSWPDKVCAALAGRYVVRYDLRDAGQSTFVDPDTPTYDLHDLVTDASELLVVLDLGAHARGRDGRRRFHRATAHARPSRPSRVADACPHPSGRARSGRSRPARPRAGDGAAFRAPEPDWADRNSVVDYMTSSRG